METGLKKLGFHVKKTNSPRRIDDDPAVLFGTSGYVNVERSQGDYLLVDRALWGDPEYVRLGWNGRNLRGDYKVPFDKAGRAAPRRKRHTPGERVILCGDYSHAPYAPEATHWKPHPAQPNWNPTGLPVAEDFSDCAKAICGSSTVAVELMLKGIPVDVKDPASMANKTLGWLAWTQWSWDEIEQGEPIRHLFDD